MKKCGKCDVTYPSTGFYKNKYSPDEYKSVCKNCSNSYTRKYRKENPDVVRRIDAKKKKKYRERYAMNEAKRKARKNKLLDTFTENDRVKLLKRFENECGICGNSYEHLDHFIPIIAGHGGTTVGNMVPMCSRCNLTKQAKNPFEWAETLDYGQKENFDKVVEYLAELNGLMVDEYREFVFWCFENPRDVDEITDENRDSLELWLRIRDAA